MAVAGTIARPDGAFPWLFRVASRPQDGAGHVSRCRALAAVLARTSPVQFVLDAEGESWIPVLASAGLPATTSWQPSAEPWAGCVLDGYHFSSDVAEQLAAQAAPLVVIDDHGSPPTCACLAINTAIGLDGTELRGVPALLGARFALLDAQYRSLDVLPINARVRHVVVTFGMTDALNATTLALTALERHIAKGSDYRITVVMPGCSAWKSMIRAAVSRLGSRCAVAESVVRMAQLLRSADLVIGSGGVGLLERMACGVPSLTLSIADNQREACEGAHRLNATRYVGTVETVSAEHLERSVEEVAADQQARVTQAERGRQLVDGRGAERVAEALMALVRRSGGAARSIGAKIPV
jgi:spore coat polysaccharide biosynthesis predicted glycosyltransferase SpsG